MTSLLYIHGFNSSSQGTKGQQITQFMAQHGLTSQLSVPDLLVEPFNAITQLEQLIAALGEPILIGSSLGGYYATYLAEKYQLKAILINPVILPHRLLGKTYSKQIDYADKSLWAIEAITEALKAVYNSGQDFIDNYIKELASLEVAPPVSRERYKVWLKTGDELLDYRFAQDWYKACDLQIDEGGKHSFADFGERLPNILKWANLV